MGFPRIERRERLSAVVFDFGAAQLRFERSDHHALIERVPVVTAVCHQAERICPSRSESIRIDRRAISAAGGGVGAAARVGGAAGATEGGAITAAGPALRADFLRAGRAVTGDHRQPRESRRGAHRRYPRASSRPATHRAQPRLRTVRDRYRIRDCRIKETQAALTARGREFFAQCAPWRVRARC